MTKSFEPTFFDYSSIGETVVLSFRAARLTDEDNLEQLGHELNTAAEKFPQNRVVLDVGSIAYVTSAVIGKWISLHRKLDRDGGKMAICGIQDPLGDILNTARLLTYFNVAADVESARTMLAE